MAGSTAPSNTFIANKSITIPPGTLDPSSRSPCRRLTHFCPTQIPKVPFFGGKQYFGSLRQPQVSDCHQSVLPKLLKPPLFAPQPINQNPPCPPPISSSGRNCKRLIGGKEKAVVKSFEKKTLKSFPPHSAFSSCRQGGREEVELMRVHQASCTFVSCLCAPARLLCSSLCTNTKNTNTNTD